LVRRFGSFVVQMLPFVAVMLVLLIARRNAKLPAALGGLCVGSAEIPGGTGVVLSRGATIVPR
jgi:hypothetical protein